MPADPNDVDLRVSTGNPGLDDILGGGLDADRMYLYEGRPGAGKTTLALQFLLDGARRGERVLYITLSETERELRLVARRMSSPGRNSTGMARVAGSRWRLAYSS